MSGICFTYINVNVDNVIVGLIHMALLVDNNAIISSSNTACLVASATAIAVANIMPPPLIMRKNYLHLLHLKLVLIWVRLVLLACLLA